MNTAAVKGENKVFGPVTVGKRTIILPKIRVVWVDNPYYENADGPSQFPVLFINGKIQTGLNDNGCGVRPKYYGKDFVIKVDDCDNDQADTEIDMWESLITPSDRKYFVPLIAYSRKEKWVCQPFVDMDAQVETSMLPLSQRNVLRRLCEKYGFEDICSGHNIGIDRATKRVILYDYGA